MNLIVQLNEVPTNRKLTIPRLANVVQRISWIGDESDRTMTIHPEIDHWIVNLIHPAPDGEKKLLKLTLDTAPRVFDKSVAASADTNGVISLPAKFAKTYGEKLRFECQPHKNTVGYWAVEQDTAEWQVDVETAGSFEVEILQGCGKGHGGSDVDLMVGDSKLNFKVEETGHFQNFRWRHLGAIDLKEGAGQTLKLIAVHKKAVAVMDCREIRLVPSGSQLVKLRRTGLNADGTRADRRDVQNTRPNVLLILTDDQGTLDAGCYGSRDLFTPRIDGLANAGIRFTQAYSHTVCCPARALLMTGRHPQRSGINSWTQGNLKEPRGVNMASSELTIAEALQENGYRTALCGKWHLGAAADSGPTTQGFDFFLGHRGGFIDNYNHYFLHGNGFHDLYRGTEEIDRRGQYFPDITVEAAKQFLSDHITNHADKPFFTYLAFNIPHYPEQGDSQFDQLFAGKPMPRQSYGRMITTVDDRIGQVLDELDRLGVRENTIIVFQSDNGHSAETNHIRVENHSSGLPKNHKYGANGGGGNTGKWRGNKGTFYEGGLRVPAIISYPNGPTQQVRDQAITLCDWMPTILDLCDLETPKDIKFDGASLRSIIDDNADSHHKVMHWQWQSRWAVRDGDWKLIGNDNGKTELVNLTDDKPESTDYASTKPEIVERLQKAHEKWKADVTGN